MKIEIVDNIPQTKMSVQYLRDYIFEIQQSGIDFVNLETNESLFALEAPIINVGVWAGDEGVADTRDYPYLVAAFKVENLRGKKATILSIKIDENSGDILPFRHVLDAKPQSDLVLAYIVNFLNVMINEKIFIGMYKKRPGVLFLGGETYCLARKRWTVETARRVKNFEKVLRNGDFKAITLEDMNQKYGSD